MPYFLVLVVLIAQVGTMLLKRSYDSIADDEKHPLKLKYKFELLVLLRDYSNSFNFYNVAELSSNKTSRNVVQVETEMKKFIVVYPCHVLHKTLNLIISRFF